MKISKFLLFFVILIIMAGASIVSWQFLFQKKTVLFLCVRNTFRSQMAEAYFEKLATERNLKNWQAKSAGFLEGEGVNPKAIILMAEEGIDISKKKSKLVNEKMMKQASKIVVVCQECAPGGEEAGYCPVLPQNKDIEYWRLSDPAKMELEEARKIRDEVKVKVIDLVGRLEK